MKGRIVTDSHAHEFRVLRNRIEGEVQAPAVVLVTSATDNDGAHLTAYGLAESLGKTHQRTALVITSSNGTDEVVAAPSAPGSRGVSESGITVITVSRERMGTISKSRVAEMVEELRAQHDYVVIDGGNLSNNSFGLLLAASADATLVTFLVGRRQLPQDRTMLDTLERSEAKVLGVVMNDQAAIDRFTERDLETEAEAVAEKQAIGPLGRAGMVLQRIGKTR